jgi:hypothetical protein
MRRAEVKNKVIFKDTRREDGRRRRRCELNGDGCPACPDGGKAIFVLFFLVLFFSNKLMERV